MKIEKVNEKQIRCTLYHTDLMDRHINITELAYGSEKARSLFREMLSKASREFDFHAENIPLMVEAVPLPDESLMLLITKVEEPDELDTHFSKFASSALDEDGYGDSDLDEEPPKRADDILSQFSDLLDTALMDDHDEDLTFNGSPENFYKIFRFPSLDAVCLAARILNDTYDAENSLYKDETDSGYYLILHMGDHTPETFNKVCNILSEYGMPIQNSSGSKGYYEEHGTSIIQGHAVQSLKNL